MRERVLILATLAVALATTMACMTAVYEPGPPPPAAAVEPSPEPAVTGEVSFFFDSLAPFGSWLTVAGYGRVWVPRVSAWWRPYTEGRWVYTDDGWTWAATEPWGWAAYHYGRWYWDTEYGWAWVPGSVWAPAWVAWRAGGGHIGWAPLPPSVRWEPGIGFPAGGVDFEAVIAPQHWCFVEERDITASVIRDHVVPPARNATFVRVTNNVTEYAVFDNRVVNHSVDVTHVERVTGQSVPRYHIADRESPAALHSQSLRTNEIPMVRRVVPVRAVGSAAATKVETVEDLHRRHELEVQELKTHHESERVRLQEIHRTEASQTPANLTADQIKARNLAEQHALDLQHQNEVQILAKRHLREIETVKGQGTVQSVHTPTPKPKRHKDSERSQR